MQFLHSLAVPFKKLWISCLIGQVSFRRHFFIHMKRRKINILAGNRGLGRGGPGLGPEPGLGLGPGLGPVRFQIINNLVYI